MTSVRLTVPLSAIRREPELSPRTGLGRDRIDWERVSAFEELLRDDPESLPPLIVVGANQATNEQLREPAAVLLADGLHRYAARELIGGDLVESVAVELHRVAPGVAPESLAYDLGVEAAAKTAKPLTPIEKRHAIVRLIADPRGLKDRPIARIVGCSPTTVGAVRRGGVHGGRAKPEKATGVAINKLARQLVRGLQQHGAPQALAAELIDRYEPTELLSIYGQLRSVLLDLHEEIAAVAASITAAAEEQTAA